MSRLSHTPSEPDLLLKTIYPLAPFVEVQELVAGVLGLIHTAWGLHRK